MPTHSAAIPSAHGNSSVRSKVAAAGVSWWVSAMDIASRVSNHAAKKAIVARAQQEYTFRADLERSQLSVIGSISTAG